MGKTLALVSSNPQLFLQAMPPITLIITIYPHYWLLSLATHLTAHRSVSKYLFLVTNSQVSIVILIITIALITITTLITIVTFGPRGHAPTV